MLERLSWLSHEFQNLRHEVSSLPMTCEPASCSGVEGYKLATVVLFAGSAAIYSQGLASGWDLWEQRVYDSQPCPFSI